MNQLRVFRALIATQIAVVALATGASLRLERTLPAALQAYLRERENRPFDTREVAVGASAVILLAALVVAWIALLRFWRIAPWFYLAATLGGLVLTLGAGPTVATSVETLLDTASSIIGGAVLAMAFFSDLRVKFGFTSAPGPR